MFVFILTQGKTFNIVLLEEGTHEDKKYIEPMRVSVHLWCLSFVGPVPQEFL